MNRKFQNPKYEYKTVEFPYCTGKFEPEQEPKAPKSSEGWRIVWRDIMMEGVFAVYRRERVPVKPRKPRLDDYEEFQHHTNYLTGTEC